MTMTRQETAKIYQFPLKGRPQEHSHSATSTRGAEAPPVVASEFGSGWYHEAAMEESQKGRKH